MGDEVAPRHFAERVWINLSGPLARWVSLALLGATILGELDEHWWFAGLFAHFRYHYLAVALTFLLLVVIRRSWVTLALIGLVIAANLWVIVAVQRVPAVSDRTDGMRLRVATLNLSYDNATPGRAISYLLASKAEIVLLQEVVPEHFKAIEALARVLPHSSPRDWRAGAENIILSKWPINEAAIVAVPARYSSATFAAVRVKGTLVRLLSLHPYPPMAAASDVMHRAAFAHYASMVRSRPGHWIVGGDFNATPWSPRFRRLVARTGLRLSGLRWAWPQSWPVPQSVGAPAFLRIGIPLDHLLVSSAFKVAGHRRGPWLGSTHYPLIVDFVVTAGPKR